MIQISMLALRIRAGIALALSLAYVLVIIFSKLPPSSRNHPEKTFILVTVCLAYVGAMVTISIWCLAKNIRFGLTRQILAGGFEGMILFACFVLFANVQVEPNERDDALFHALVYYMALIVLGIPLTMVGAAFRALVYIFIDFIWWLLRIDSTKPLDQSS